MLNVKGVKVFFGGVPYINIEEFSFNTTKTYQIIGEEGSGKSLVFDFLSGIHRPDVGEIDYDGISLYDSGFMELSMLRKKLGVMFDVPGLLSNQTIYQNISLAIKSKNIITEKSLRLIIKEDYLRPFGLETALDVRPSEISNQQKKIVSFIRAIISKPDFLVFDNFTDFLIGGHRDIKIKFLKDLISQGVGGVFFCKESVQKNILEIDHTCYLKNGELNEHAAA